MTLRWNLTGVVCRCVRGVLLPACRHVSQNHLLSMLGFALVFLTRDEGIFELALSSELCPFPFEIPAFNFHSRNPSVGPEPLYCTAYSLQASTSTRLCFNVTEVEPALRAGLTPRPSGARRALCTQPAISITWARICEPLRAAVPVALCRCVTELCATPGGLSGEASVQEWP